MVRVEVGREERMEVEGSLGRMGVEEGRRGSGGSQVYVSAICSLEDFHILQVKDLDTLRR